MPAYVELQEREFALEEQGYTATRHQREVGAGYFDRVAEIVSGGESLDARARGLDRGGAVRARRRLGWPIELTTAGDEVLVAGGARLRRAASTAS